MKALLIHAGEFSFHVKRKAVKGAEIPERRSWVGTNVLVAYVAVEKGDAECIDEIASEFASDIQRQVARVKPSSLVIYPYAHLSNRLAPPPEAQAVMGTLLKDIEKAVRDLEIIKAPFGWYKEFKVHCLGHPLSELSRNYSCRERPCGFRGGPLATEVCKVIQREGVTWKLPANLMGKFSIKVSSDTARGASLSEGERGREIYQRYLEESLRIAGKLGVSVEGMPVRTFCGGNEGLRGTSLSPKGDGELVEERLCVGDGRLTPFRLLRELLITIPCSTDECVIRNMSKILRIMKTLKAQLGLTSALLVEIGEDLGRDLLGLIKSIIGNEFPVVKGNHASPALRAGLAVQACGGVVELTGITLHGEGGKVLLTLSPLGPYENLLISAFFKALRKLEAGLTPALPTWLLPEEVRLITVEDRYVDFAEEIADQLKEAGIRVGIDARSVGLGRKIRDAGKAWIPYVAVVGEREKATRTLNVRVRDLGKQLIYSAEELTDEVLGRRPSSTLSVDEYLM